MGEGKDPGCNVLGLVAIGVVDKVWGAWIDSTVLCTGVQEFNGSKVQEYLEADLFLFQYSPKGTTEEISISNWFITACANNEVLMVLRDMLYAYWRDYDCVLDYYIFHLFFAMIAKEYPEEIAKMPYGSSRNSIFLMHHLGDKFQEQKWEKLKQKVCFHKLSYRLREEILMDKDNYYNRILELYEYE